MFLSSIFARKYKKKSSKPLKVAKRYVKKKIDGKEKRVDIFFLIILLIIIFYVILLFYNYKGFIKTFLIG